VSGPAVQFVAGRAGPTTCAARFFGFWTTDATDDPMAFLSGLLQYSHKEPRLVDRRGDIVDALCAIGDRHRRIGQHPARIQTRVIQ
jgi:hypothetical protein